MKISKTKHITKNGTVKRNPTKPKFKTIPMDLEWKQRLEVRLIEYRRENPELVPLERKLLSYGGEAVALVFEEDLDKILKRGIILDGSKSNMMPGTASQCHQNSVCLWRLNRKHNNKNVVIMTGWALSQDGCWRQHSWVYDKSYKKVIETTERRVAYFGFKMSELESIKFAEDNR